MTKKTKKNIKKNNKKLKRNKKNTTKTLNKKYMKKGGEMPELSNIIGQGTHGTIYNLKNDNTLVAKVFQNRKRACAVSLCTKIQANNCEICDELNYEYIIQNIINSCFKDYDLNIIVPNAYKFEKVGTLCYYIMDKIFYLEDKILFINMTDSDTIKKTNIGNEIGYEIACNYLDLSPQKLAYEIGSMFSLLHFKLNLDGYDCELIIGQNKINTEKPQLYFIDFDKVSCFEFKAPQILYRKISEETIEEKQILTAKKLANFLFQSFISMSLLPIDNDLKQDFLEGYHKYFDVKNSFEKEVMEQIIQIVNEYEI
jgi:hypothetical protein